MVGKPENAPSLAELLLAFNHEDLLVYREELVRLLQDATNEQKILLVKQFMLEHLAEVTSTETSESDQPPDPESEHSSHKSDS